MQITAKFMMSLLAASLALGSNANAMGQDETEIAAARKTCKMVYSCEEAVELWCGGYRRADGDNDGIPCENVCSTRREVEEIRDRIGC